MDVRDRVKSLRRIRASELEPHPANWRRHPTAQRAALEGVLAEVGWAGALLARELPDGRLQLLDGHLRADVAAGAEVPVLVTDLDEAEARTVLATYDPLGAMAETDGATLSALLSGP